MGFQGRSDFSTAHLDALAGGGVRFRQGYLTAPFCCPSRAGLLTGRCQTRFGHQLNVVGKRNLDPAIGLPTTEVTLADRLRQAGYRTGLVGKGKWDVIHLNFGRHGLKRLDDGVPQVDIAGYERYAGLCVQRLKRTGAKLVFATTTPAPEGKVSPPRQSEDVVMYIRYNRTALAVMEREGIMVNDGE